MNIKIILSYDGSKFDGSATQPSRNTVQDILENSFKLINIDTKTIFSGRTDKNVHATRQVVSCVIPSYWDNLTKLKKVLNKLLPNSILIRSIFQVDDSFHARFSAKKRSYRYIISTKPYTPFSSNYVYNLDSKIDIKLLKEASKYFIGVFDFEYFSKKGSDPKSTIREIYNVKVYTYTDLIIIHFSANSYLRSQIRMMVDFLLKIATSKLTIEQLQLQLTKKKLISWTLAPASGLYLSKIYY